jgi:hypothetical protein
MTEHTVAASKKQGPPLQTTSQISPCLSVASFEDRHGANVASPILYPTDAPKATDQDY